MQGKHSWLHFVNYLIYTSIPLTIISCSQATGDSLGTPIRDIFSPHALVNCGGKAISIVPGEWSRCARLFIHSLEINNLKLKMLFFLANKSY